MLGLQLQTLSTPTPFAIPIPIPIQIPKRCFIPQIHRHPIPNQSRSLSIYAADQKTGKANNGGVGGGGGGGGGDDDEKKRRENGGLNVGWAGQLKQLLDPDPDNLFAVGLTGLLTWASVQVVWQLLVVSVAIVVAGLKYSLVAALLLFILIALL